MKTPKFIFKVILLIIFSLSSLILITLIHQRKEVFDVVSHYACEFDENLDVTYGLFNETLIINPSRLFELITEQDQQIFSGYSENPFPCNKKILYNGIRVKLPVTIQSFNSDCLRAVKEYPIPKPKNVTRIILLGDSFVFGLGVNDSDTLSSLLESLLSNKSFEVINLGVGGYNPLLSVQRLERIGLKYEPDLVILGYVNNDYEDAFISTIIIPKVIKYLKQRGFSDEGAILLIEKCVDTWKKNPEKFFQFSSMWQGNVKEPLERLIALGKKHSFSIMLYSYPLEGGPISEDEYLGLVRGLAQKNNVTFYYLPEEIGYSFSGEWMLHPKDGHPSPYANMRTAEFLAGKILEMVDREDKLR